MATMSSLADTGDHHRWTRRGPERSRRRAAVVAAVVAAIAWVTLGSIDTAAAQQEAPQTTVSADARTVSGGGKAVTASTTQNLDPAGQTVTVEGSGFDETKGIYVVLCVIPPPGQKPTPCGGGADQAGSSGASAWITSDPPAGGEGVSTPYGPGGSFRVQLRVGATINASLDCRQVRCAIVTRNDHIRGSDRSQDLLLPVTFASDAPTGSTPATTAAPPTTAAATTTTTTTTAPPAPEATISANGRSASAGDRTLTVSQATDLDPAAADVTVDGEGFAPDTGLYLALCRLPDDPASAPGPCLGGPEATQWWSSDPPDYGVDLAQPFEPDGSFHSQVTITAVIDDETDCREVACGLGVRRDDVDAGDRTQDLFVPVSFAATPTESEADADDDADQLDESDAAATSAGDADGDGRGGGSAVAPTAGVVAVAALAGGVVWWRRRRTGTEAPSP